MQINWYKEWEELGPCDSWPLCLAFQFYLKLFDIRDLHVCCTTKLLHINFNMNLKIKLLISKSQSQVSMDFQTSIHTLKTMLSCSQYLISWSKTQLHFERTWLHNTVKLDVVSWGYHTPREAIKQLLLPCYITMLDEQDPENRRINSIDYKQSFTL